MINLFKVLYSILLLAALVLPARATLYYVATTGNDNNGGTNPTNGSWLSYTNAAAHVVAGDTVLVQPGSYTAENAFALTGAPGFILRASGTSNAPITFKANGAVTNLFSFTIRAPYYVIDGFNFDGGGVQANRPVTGGSMPGPSDGSHNLAVTNCTVIHSGLFSEDTPPDGAVDPLNTTHDNLVVNCSCRWVTNQSGMVGLFGANDVVQGCYFGDSPNSWGISFMGSNNVVRQNTFTNLVPDLIDGVHSDIFMVLGNNGRWSVSNRFEQNYIVNCNAQSDMSMQSGSGATPNTNTYLWSITVQNNFYKDSSKQFSIELPNIKFYNNTFLRCSGPIAYSWYDPTWSGFRGYVDNGAVINNAFIDCTDTFAESSQGPSVAILTNGVSTVKGSTAILLDGGVFYVSGTYSNLAGTITSGALYEGATELYSINATNFSAGTFSAAIAHTDPANGVSYADQQGYYLGNNIGVRIKTTSVPAGEVAGFPVIYVNSHIGSIAAASISNYVGTANALALLNAGTNLSAFGVTNYYDGSIRPAGLFTVGALPIDTSLKVHLDFDESLTGRILDVTGNTNNALRMDGTNWISATNGAFGSAGFFHYVGTLPTNNPPGAAYSQYGAITNLNGIATMTNATISVWAQFGPNVDYVMCLLDCGYYTSANSWMLARDSTPYLTFATFPDTGGNGRIQFPTDVVIAGGGSPDFSTTNFHMYSVTVNGLSNQVIGYYDGQAFQTNTLGTDHLSTPGWLAVGAMQHQGTPQWGDDFYPNAGFFVGKLDDVRIYNRTLSAGDMGNLYAGANLSVQSQSTNSGTGPTIISEPQNASMLSGTSTSFSVVATNYAACETNAPTPPATSSPSPQMLRMINMP